MTAAKTPKFADTQPERHETASAGKGMPAKPARAGRTRVGLPLTPQDASDEASLAMPHERDQSTAMTARKPDPAIVQAGRDLDRGLQDTSKGAEMNRAYDKLK